MALSVMGCASRGAMETLEAELREKEDRIISLEGDLTKARGDLEVARREGQTLRQQMSPHGGALLEEQSQVLSRVEKIRFHPLLTTGMDTDGRAGDEKLSVLLMPVDREGELLRLPGKVELDLYDMTLPAEQQKIGEWTFTPSQTRSHWLRSLLSAGYQFQVEWKTPPHSPELTLHGRLTVADGRQFDATSQVKVRLAQSSTMAETKENPPAPPVNDKDDELFTRPVPDTPTVRTKKEPAIRRVSNRLSTNLTSDENSSLKPPSRRRSVITSDRFTEAQIPTLR